MLTVLALFFATQVVSPSANHESYVFADGDSITNCGSWNDDDMHDLRASYGSRFFWFRYRGAAYIVRDAATLDAVRELFRKQRELGQQQSALGHKQSELGRQQSEYGRQQSLLGQEQSRLSSRVTYDSDARERMRELGDQMRALGETMRALGDKMRLVGNDMRDLGDQMREEGEKIERQLRSMAPALIERGVAREVTR